MPIYEYRCNDCEREFSQLFLNSKEICGAKCKFCGSMNLVRLISTFRVHQSESSRLANLDTSKPPDEAYYRDSRNIGLRAKKRMKELGVDLGPKMDEIVEKGRTGKILDDYNK